jgi:hypothetical protein
MDWGDSWNRWLETRTFNDAIEASQYEAFEVVSGRMVRLSEELVIRLKALNSGFW